MSKGFAWFSFALSVFSLAYNAAVGPSYPEWFRRGGAAMMALTLVIGLALIITWALDRRRARIQRERDAAFPRCKHGVRKPGPPKCDACTKDDEAFFAADKRPTLTTVTFKDNGPIQINMVPAQMGLRPSPELWEHWPSDDHYTCRTCGYTVDHLSAVNNGTAAFGHSCRPTPMRYCAEPNCSYSQPVDQAWFHCCIKVGGALSLSRNVPLAKFRVGQWVRVKEGRYGAGELHLISKVDAAYRFPCRFEYREDSCVVGADADEIEPALPHAGEWWTLSEENPSACAGSAGTAGIPFLVIDPDVLCKNACCRSVMVPVNFGKGKR